jgi:hypothetical protein
LVGELLPDEIGPGLLHEDVGLHHFVGEPGHFLRIGAVMMQGVFRSERATGDLEEVNDFLHPLAGIQRPCPIHDLG